MALVIVGRELRLGVEVNYRWQAGRYNDVAALAFPGLSTTLSISLGREHGEERLPLLLHYYGVEFALDKEASSPENPLYRPLRVDEKMVVFTDRQEHRITVQDREVEQFLRGQGFQILCLSADAVEADAFARAAEAIRLLTGKSWPPS